MSINERLKQLRKDQRLNQGEFGERIGLKQGAISKMEQDGNAVIDQNIRLICNTFSVSEHWLRTGEGEMYEETQDILLKQLATQYKLEGEKLELIRNFLLLTDEQQEAIVRAACVIAEANKKASASAADVPPAPPYPTPPGLELDPIIEDKVKKIRAKLYAQAATQHLFTTSPSIENSLENEKSRL